MSQSYEPLPKPPSPSGHRQGFRFSLWYYYRTPSFPKQSPDTFVPFYHLFILYCRPPGFAVIFSGKYLAGGLQSGCIANLIRAQYNITDLHTKHETDCCKSPVQSVRLCSRPLLQDILSFFWREILPPLQFLRIIQSFPGIFLS